MTRVTVIIPVYNRAGPTREAVASVLEQDLVADIVLVDDGSTDDTPQTLDELAASADGRITVVRRPNGGPGAARNTGVEQVDGGLITFLDSDDLMTPGRLTKQVSAWSADPRAVVIGRERLEVADGVDPGAHVRRRQEQGETRYQTSALLSVEQFRAVGGFDESMWFAEDSDLLQRLTEAGNRIVVLDDVVIVRRILGDNLVIDPAADRSVFDLLRKRAQRARGQS
jgi:glycosyltransferase involved in cell wall biosynthesis